MKYRRQYRRNNRRKYRRKHGGNTGGDGGQNNGGNTGGNTGENNGGNMRWYNRWKYGDNTGGAQVELPVVPPEAKQPSRFFFAVLSGVVFFAAYASVTIGNKTIDALIYSVTYNGSYLAVEEIITIIVISIPPVKKALDYVKQMANSR
ncbi:MAG: energy-coupled thiamine transporter ThiT [Agathobacter rectalis]